MPQRHPVPLAARGFAIGKGGKNLCQGLLQRELAVLVQEHGHRSGRDYFSDAGQVKHSSRGNRVCRCIVGKTANPVEREHPALRQHTEGCARESLLRNRSLENGVRSSKLKTLRRRGAWDCNLRRSHGHHQRCYPTRCLLSVQMNPLRSPIALRTRLYL